MMILKYISLGIGIAGVAVIVWGSVITLFEIFTLEGKRLVFRQKDVCKRLVFARHHMGTYLLLGLEFLIAADIIKTIAKPSLQEIAILGSIVAIRTVISFSLDREMRRGHECG